MIPSSKSYVFYDEWSALFGWAHAEAKAGNIRKARLLFEIAERLSERNRKYIAFTATKRKGLFYV